MGLVAKGSFEGRGGHILRGRFIIETDPSGTRMTTSEDFYFDGSPAPGFAISASGILSEAEARESDFFRLPGSGRLSGQQIEVEGVQISKVPDNLLTGEPSTLFLWCFQTPFLLGLSKIEYVKPLGELTLDESLYRLVAEAFRDRFVEQIIRNLLEKGFIKNNRTLSVEDKSIIYEFAFTLFATLEGQGGVKVKNRRHPAVLSFADFSKDEPSRTRPLYSKNLIVSRDRTLLHGELTDELIDQIYNKVTA